MLRYFVWTKCILQTPSIKFWDSFWMQLDTSLAWWKKNSSSLWRYFNDYSL